MVYINIVFPCKIVVNAVLKKVLNVLTLTANFVGDLILCIELKDGVNSCLNGGFLPVGL